MFNWVGFLDSRNIPYASSGPNTSKGNVAIHCPFCGYADESMHMSVSTTGAGWRCWRRPEHRGINPVRLIQALLSCSWDTASSIAGSNTAIPNDFMSTVMGHIHQQKPIEIKPLRIPKEFKKFGTDLPSGKPFVAYLTRREFSKEHIKVLTDWYGIYYCNSGLFKGRIIFTIQHDDKLITWTGRTIGNSPARYKTLSPDREKAFADKLPQAIGPISDYILWYDKLRKGGHTIVLVEGPFDSLKVDILGMGLIRSTCFFTSTPSNEQINLLYEILPKFKNRVLLLDQGTTSTTFRLCQEFKSLDLIPKHLPKRIKDPGDIVSTAELQFIIDFST